MRRKMRSCWIAWWKWTGCAISVDHCMSSSATGIPLASSLLPTSTRFASLHDATDSRYRSTIELMDLAKAKLLDGPSSLVENDRSGNLACLSVGFALEFNMDGSAGDVARTQVERHMRLCLAVTAGRDTLVTLAGSEPLLAEAAY